MKPLTPGNPEVSATRLRVHASYHVITREVATALKRMPLAGTLFALVVVALDLIEFFLHPPDIAQVRCGKFAGDTVREIFAIEGDFSAKGFLPVHGDVVMPAYALPYEEYYGYFTNVPC